MDAPADPAHSCPGSAGGLIGGNDMCSIIGYCGPVADMAAVQAGFQRTISRGPDDSRVIQAGPGLLGFHRLAIMGLTPEGMQPFALDGSFAVCNG